MPKHTPKKSNLYSYSENSRNSENENLENEGAMFFDTGSRNSLALKPMQQSNALGNRVKAAPRTIDASDQPQPKFSIGSSSANEMEPEFHSQLNAPTNDPFAPQLIKRHNWSDGATDPNAKMVIRLPKHNNNTNTFNSATASQFSSGSFAPEPAQPEPQAPQVQPVQPEQHAQPVQPAPQVQPAKTQKKHNFLKRLINRVPKLHPKPRHTQKKSNITKKVKNNTRQLARQKAVNLKNKAVQGTKKLATRIKNKLVSMKRKIYPNQFKYHKLKYTSPSNNDTSSGKVVSLESENS